MSDDGDVNEDDAFNFFLHRFLLRFYYPPTDVVLLLLVHRWCKRSWE